MRRRLTKKHPPFISLPRHKRSDEVIRLKGMIKRDADKYGGLFTSHGLLDEPGRPELYDQWFDFYFPGKDRFMLWNAEIVTARKAFWDTAHKLAQERVIAMLTPEEHAAESNIAFEPAEFSGTGKILSYQLSERKKTRYEKFGGLTFFEQWDKLAAEIVREEPPTIYELFHLDRSFAYGIGLFVVVDVNIINRQSIEWAIHKFRELGETDWQAGTPVSRERLPFESEKEALDTIKHTDAYRQK